MKLTFPHMGNLTLCMKPLFESLGFQVILPPPITKKTLDLGVKYSPEFACFPFKVNMGNYIEALEKGADTIMMLGEIGPCRFGYYAQIQRRVLQDLNYNFDMVIIEPPENSAKELVDELKKLKNNNSWRHVLPNLYLTFNKIKAFDWMDQKVNETRPRTTHKKQLDKIYEEFQQEIEKIDSTKDIKQLTHDMNSTMENLKDISKTPVKVAIVGEIYMLMEFKANMEIERKLGNMGAHVIRTNNLSDSILDHIVLDKFGLERNKKIQRAAKPYLNHFVGGHGNESVGEAVLKAKAGYDGLIHVMPFTCAPETIAQNVLPQVSSDYNFPLLTVILDEQTGDAGLKTRLEAFYDLLVRKSSFNKMCS